MTEPTNNLKQLLKRLEETLIAAIPLTIQEMGVKERAYCVFIVFHDTTVYDDYRPNLVVAPERLRRELFDTELHAADIVWNPSLLDVHELAPGGCPNAPGLQELCHEIYRILIRDRQDRCNEHELLSPVRSTMHRVAASLNQFQWSEVLEITDDFIVVAIDDLGLDPQADIKACVVPERIALLDSRGLLVNRTAKCPECSAELRSPQARQCFHCGASWR